LNLRVLGIVFGTILLVSGFGVALSSRAIMSMCNKDCWLNGLLYAFLGEHNAKIALGAIWYGIGVCFIYLGVFGWSKVRRGK
jgi:hypothetical protein